jgi:tRNA A22 N-methylase
MTLDCEYCKMGRGIYDMKNECCIERYEREIARYDPIRQKIATEARERLEKARQKTKSAAES